MGIYEKTYYRKQHVTGTGSVLVSISFGATPEKGVLVTKKLNTTETSSEVQFDLENHLDEILCGVNEANEMYNGSLEVQEIEVIPTDYPTKGQARNAAFLISEYVLNKDT